MVVYFQGEVSIIYGDVNPRNSCCGHGQSVASSDIRCITIGPAVLPNEKSSCASVLMMKTTDIRILPRRARCGKHFFDAGTFHSMLESITVDTIAIANHTRGVES